MPSRLESLAQCRRRVRAGEALFRSGDAFRSLYGVREGFFKTYLLDGDGHSQVTGFFMAGELLGLDGIGSDRHHLTAIALAGSLVSVLPYALVEEHVRGLPALQHDVHAALSREIAHKQHAMLLLGSERAEERLASFLLDLSQRLERRGCSPLDFCLPMTQKDAGSYLGLAHETVCRLFSKFQEQGILEIRRRHVRLLDPARLRSLAGVPAG